MTSDEQLQSTWPQKSKAAVMSGKLLCSYEFEQQGSIYLTCARTRPRDTTRHSKYTCGVSGASPLCQQFQDMVNKAYKPQPPASEYA